MEEEREVGRKLRWQDLNLQRSLVFLIERGHRKGPGSHRQQSIMFVLTVLQDTLRIPPHNLSLPLQDALTRQICSLYFDKVLKDLGLCVTLYDIKAVEGGFVFPGDGAPRFTVSLSCRAMSLHCSTGWCISHLSLSWIL